jgi:hypothetical protein
MSTALRYKPGDYVHYPSGDKDSQCHVVIATPDQPRQRNPGPGTVEVEKGNDYVIIPVPKDKRADVKRPYIQAKETSLEPINYISIEIRTPSIDQVLLASLVELAIERATLIEAGHPRNNVYQLNFWPHKFDEAKEILNSRKIDFVVLKAAVTS